MHCYLFLHLLLLHNTLAATTTPKACLPPPPKTKVEPKEGPGAADILFVVDTSGSMGSEAATVAANLQSFGGYLDAEGIDYHLIVVARDMSSVRLCVKSPVATTKCNTEVPPCCDEGERFLKTNTYIASTDACEEMVAAEVYKEYSAKLRKDSGKTIVFVSDDKISGTYGCTSATCKTAEANKWFAALQAIDVDGYFAPTPKLPRGVMVHSIDGHDCGGEPGRGSSYTYKGLAEQTGGTNFELCATDWTPYFSVIAGAVGTTTVGSLCSHGVPRSSSNSKLLLGGLEPDTPFDVTFEYGAVPKTAMVFQLSPNNKCAEQSCTYTTHSCVCDLRCPSGSVRSGDGSECTGGSQGTCSLGYCHNANPNNLPECTLDPSTELLFTVDDISDPQKVIFCRQTCKTLRHVSGTNGGDVSFSFKPVAKLKSITVGGRGKEATKLFGESKQFHPAHSFPNGHPYTSRSDCGGAPTRPTIPTTGPSLYPTGTCAVASGEELFYALDPLSGRSNTFVTGAGLMIFFMVNSIGETYFGVEIGYDGTAHAKKGYVVLDVIISGSSITSGNNAPDWVLKDDVGGSSFSKWTSGELSGRILLNNKDGKTAGGMLGPLPAFDFCVDLVIAEASGSVTSASIINFDSDINSATPSVPTQQLLDGEFMEEGGMRFCADSCSGTTTNDQETDNTVQCWTKKNTFETFCPFREENKIIADEKAAVEAAAIAKNNSGVNGTGWGDESGGSAGLVLALMFFCCCLPALGAVLYIKREQVKIFIEKQKEKQNIKKKENPPGIELGVAVSNGGVGLPPGWTEAIDEGSGYPYYTNESSGAVQWDRPVSQSMSNPMNASNNHGRKITVMPPGWKKDHDESGNAYYYKGDEIQWEKPPGN